jgi:hypothetical protein
MDDAVQHPQTGVESTPLLFARDDVQQLSDSERQKSSSAFGEISLLLRIGPGLLLGYAWTSQYLKTFPHADYLYQNLCSQF